MRGCASLNVDRPHSPLIYLVSLLFPVATDAISEDRRWYREGEPTTYSPQKESVATYDIPARLRRH